MDWKPIRTAPFDRDLGLAVIDEEGPHALVFSCRRVVKGWMKVENTERVEVHPTHWRDWQTRACTFGRVCDGQAFPLPRS